MLRMPMRPTTSTSRAWKARAFSIIAMRPLNSTKEAHAVQKADPVLRADPDVCHATVEQTATEGKEPNDTGWRKKQAPPPESSSSRVWSRTEKPLVAHMDGICETITAAHAQARRCRCRNSTSNCSHQQLHAVLAATTTTEADIIDNETPIANKHSGR